MKGQWTLGLRGVCTNHSTHQNHSKTRASLSPPPQLCQTKTDKVWCLESLAEGIRYSGRTVLGWGKGSGAQAYEDDNHR